VECGKQPTEDKFGIRFLTKSGSRPLARLGSLHPIRTSYMSGPESRRGAMAFIARRTRAPHGRTLGCRTCLLFRRSSSILRIPTSQWSEGTRSASRCFGGHFPQRQKRRTAESLERSTAARLGRKCSLLKTQLALLIFAPIPVPIPEPQARCTQRSIVPPPALAIPRSKPLPTS